MSEDSAEDLASIWSTTHRYLQNTDDKENEAAADNLISNIREGKSLSSERPQLPRQEQMIYDAILSISGEDDSPWLTRSELSQLLGSRSGRLNPSRLQALHRLVDKGYITQRPRPDDPRETRQYRLRK